MSKTLDQILGDGGTVEIGVDQKTLMVSVSVKRSRLAIKPETIVLDPFTFIETFGNAIAGLGKVMGDRNRQLVAASIADATGESH